VAPTCTSTFTAATLAGASPLAITCSGGTPTANYSFHYVDGSLTITSNSIATTTGLAVNHPTSVYGTPVRFTATVTPSAGSGTAGGTVTFNDGQTFIDTCSLSGGTCFIDVSSLAFGSHSVTASYGNNGSYLASTSTAVSHTVDTVNGTVTNGTTQTISGGGGLSLTLTAGGSDVAVAFTMGGDPALNPAATPFVVDGTTAYVTITASPDSSPYTVCLPGVAPARLYHYDAGVWTDITWIGISGPDQTTAIGSSQLCAVTNTLSPFVVAVPKTVTTTTISSSVSSAPEGSTVTFTAHVSPKTATGTVSFYDGSTKIPGSTCTLVSGATTADCTYAPSGLAAGSHDIKAVYEADGHYATSQSAPTTVIVTPTATLTPPATPTHAASIDYTLTFSSAVTGLAAGDFAVSGSAATGLTACVVTPTGTGASYTVSVTGCVDGSLVLTLKADSVTENSVTGPAAAVVASTVAIDRTAPTVTAFTAPATPTGAATLTYTLTFSEAVSGLAKADFAVSGTATGCTVGAPSGAGASYTVALTNCSDGTVTLTLNAGTVADAAGNTAPASNRVAAAVTIDRTAPTATLACTPNAGATKLMSIPCTVTFSEAPGLGTTFTAGDILIGGSATLWTASAPAGSGTGPYTFTLTGTGVDGTLTVAVAAGAITDAVGNPTTASATVSVVIDRKAPTVAAPKIAIRSGAALSGTAIPVTVQLGGSDGTGSGIDHYIVARSTNGGKTWTTVSSSAPAAYAISVASSGTVRFRSRSVDKAGNTSGWSTSSLTFTPRLTQQTSATYVKTWKSTSSKLYSGGSEKYSVTKSATATFRFTGRSIGLVTTLGAGRGQVRVYINSKYVTTVDLNAATTQYRAVAWSQTWSTSATRTIKLVVVGTAGRPRVDLDAFAVIK
jgi:hypothetical protein